MRALQITDLIGPDGVTVLNDAPEPHDDARSVIVETAFAGVSFPDLLQTRGMYQIRPEPPFTPGVEAAGVVRSAPEGSGFVAGDRVAVWGTACHAEVIAAHGGRMDVLGHSMGAATALLTAVRDERVGAVVAVAPYSSMRAVVRSAMASRAGWADRWVSLDDLTERLVVHASGRADFDPAMASPIESAPALDVPVLYLHGEDDCVVPEVQSRALAEVTAESFRQTFPGSSHVDPVRRDHEWTALVASSFLRIAFLRERPSPDVPR